MVLVVFYISIDHFYSMLPLSQASLFLHEGLAVQVQGKEMPLMNFDVCPYELLTGSLQYLNGAKNEIICIS